MSTTSNELPNRLYRFAIAVLSLLTTPVLIFVSTSVSILLLNTADLGLDYGLLQPFLLVTLCAVVCGILLWFSATTSLGNFLLWCYYLLGLSYLAFTLLRPVDVLRLNECVGLLFYAGLWVVLAMVLSRKKSAYSIAPFIALLAVLFLSADLYRLYANNNLPSESFEKPKSALVSRDKGNSKGNIYHLVFDEFQTDFFKKLLNPELNRQFKGFTLFENTTALYDMTSWSIPSVFLGEPYKFDESIESYHDRAFNSAASLHTSISEAGYSSIAYMRNNYAVEMAQLDLTVPHSRNIEFVFDHSKAFATLWAYASLPLFMIEWMADRDILVTKSALDDLEEKTFFAESAPQESFLSFQNFLRQEERLPESGRYTFVHLMIPHGPHIYDEQCQESDDASVLSQSACAIRLLQQFILELKRLGRLDDSLVLVHGDHGGRVELVDGQLKDTKARSPYTLLLMKPPGADSDFTVSQLKVSLPMLAPLLKSYVSSEIEVNSPPLIAELEILANDSDEQDFYRVKGESRMIKYTLRGGELIRGKTTKIPRCLADCVKVAAEILLFDHNTIFEAEAGSLSTAAEIRDDLAGVQGHYVVNGIKSYRLELERKSRVRLWARVITPNGNSDSTILRVDDENSGVWSMGVSKEWHWVKSPVTWTLDKGPHVVSLRYREPIYLDQLRFEVEPILAGDVEIPMFDHNTVFEAESGYLGPAVEVRDDLAGTEGYYVVNGTKAYRFELQQKSRVSLRIRVITPNGNSDSNTLHIDDQNSGVWSMGVSKEWHWAKSPFTWTLEKGAHVVALKYREPVYLDQLRLEVEPLLAGTVESIKP